MEIRGIYCVNQTWLLCGKMFIPSYFDNHFNSYVVEEKCPWTVVKPGEEIGYHCLDGYRKSDGQISIPLRHWITVSTMISSFFHISFFFLKNNYLIHYFFQVNYLISRYNNLVFSLLEHQIDGDTLLSLNERMVEQLVPIIKQRIKFNRMMDNLNIDKMDKNHEYVNLNKI